MHLQADQMDHLNGGVVQPPSDRKTIEKPFMTTVSQQPVTSQRRLYIPTDDVPANAGVARANIAATREKPNGTTENDYAARHAHETVLQQHCAYWDPDGDGVVWPTDVWTGCRNWGTRSAFSHLQSRTRLTTYPI